MTSAIQKQFGGDLKPVKASVRGSLLCMSDTNLEVFCFVCSFLSNREVGLQMTVRMLAGLLALFVCFLNYCWVFLMFERGMAQQQLLPLIRNLKLQLLSARDLNVEKTKEGKFACVHLRDCLLAKAASPNCSKVQSLEKEFEQF